MAVSVGVLVMVHLVSPDSGRFTPTNRSSSSAIACSSGRIEDHTVLHVVPNRRARPAIEACSRRIWLIAHQHALVVAGRVGSSRSCRDGSAQRHAP